MNVTTDQLPVDKIIQWDIENWSHLLDFWSLKTNLDLQSSHALDVGAREGGLSLYLALKGATVICSDIRESYLERAKDLHKEYDVSEKITYATVDACDMPFPDCSFDLVVFKSVLGGLSEYSKQKQMIKEIFRVLRAGGELWFAENLLSTVVHQAARKLLSRQRWRYVTISEINELCRPFKTVNLKPYGLLASFGRTKGQQKVLGKIDWAIDRYIPTRWKYIAFVAAQK